MSKYVFEKLRKYSGIIVTGPQRSGTTFAAAAIAYSLGYAFYPDERIGQRDVGRLKDLMATEVKFSLQCPALFYMIQDFDFYDAAIVVMRRKTQAIRASIDRIEWDGSKEEFLPYKEDGRYSSVVSEHVRRFRGNALGFITGLKYDVFDKVQRLDMKMPWFDLYYDSLGWHPLWIPKRDRMGFAARQISKKYPNATQERIGR